MNIIRLYVFFFLLSATVVSSGPILTKFKNSSFVQGIKKTFGSRTQKMPEEHRVSHLSKEQARLDDRKIYLTRAQEGAKEARLRGDRAGALKHDKEGFARQLSIARLQGNVDVLKSGKPVKIEEPIRNKPIFRIQ